MRKSDSNLYDPEFVRGMFDRMSKTYGLANLITSFGFTARWRRQCVRDLPTVGGSFIGFDFMSGMGESWIEIQKKNRGKGKIIAIDISDEMNRKANEHLKRLKTKNVELKELNILNNDIPSESADFIVSTFGLKTFSSEQQRILAGEVARILKPGGSFSMIEISVPRPLILRSLFMFYLTQVIPLIGRIFLRNSQDYKMLGQYCLRFRNGLEFHEYLSEFSLKSRYKKYFFGCATGVYGTKL